jgi:all-trans-retinol 13,14-reductase
MPRFGPWPEQEDAHHVVIVGAGIGGLTAGALLAHRGLKVLVLEAHDRPGGFCTSWTRTIRRDGRRLTFCFDAGVQDISGLGPRGPLRQLLRQLGAEHALDWRRVRHAYARDGLLVTVPPEATAFAAELQDLFPGEHAGIGAFFEQILAVYRELYADIEQTGGVPRAPQSAEAVMAWPARHPHAWRWIKQPFASLLDAYLTDARLKALLTTLAEYITDRPELLTVADMAPLFGYYFDGGYYPAGGSQRLADLLSAIITDNGGAVRLRRAVSQVVVENGRAVGVATADGRVHRAALVLANSDVVSSMAELVGLEHLSENYREKLGRLRRGPSAVIVSLGVRQGPALPARIFVSHQGLDFGIGNPSAIDPSLAPPGHAAVTMLCLLSEEQARSWDRSHPDYPRRKDTFADDLIAAAEATVWPELGRHIVYRQVAGPPTFARYARTGGCCIYGAARGQWCPDVVSPVPGLMLVGAGTRSGAGIEAVVVSGTIAADLIFGRAAEEVAS